VGEKGRQKMGCGVRRHPSIGVKWSVPPKNLQCSLEIARPSPAGASGARIRSDPTGTAAHCPLDSLAPRYDQTSASLERAMPPPSSATLIVTSCSPHTTMTLGVGGGWGGLGGVGGTESP
jgi:hypothetical protein